MDALARLAEAAERITQRPTLIREARHEGATRAQIAKTLTCHAPVSSSCATAHRDQHTTVKDHTSS